MGLLASAANALTHDDYLTPPELENSCLIIAHASGTASQTTLRTVLELGISELKPRMLGYKSTPLCISPHTQA